MSDKKQGYLSSIFSDRTLPVVIWAVGALILTFLIELLGRRSVVGVFSFIGAHPFAALYNYLIILVTLSPSLFFKRKYFVMTIVTLLWLAFAVANCVILSFRSDPLSIADLRIIGSAAGMFTLYVNAWQIALILLALAAAVALCVFVWRKLPSRRIGWKRSLVCVGAAVTIFATSTLTGLNFERFFPQGETLDGIYDDYGFASCFSYSLIHGGIYEPEKYSRRQIDEIINSLESADEEKEIKPNIIFLQLESFFDIDRQDGVTVSADPIPFFHELKNSCPGGKLTVQTAGAGTVHTEFEVLTGMNVDFFGLGESPYYTALQKRGCLSIPHSLSKYGYTSHAMHNNTGTFYDRDIVYSYLGFDDFTPIEYMNGLEYNSLGWALDSVLQRPITEALNSTEGSDFIFAVSVEAHGRYPNRLSERNGSFTATDTTGELNEKQLAEWDFYVNELPVIDDFLRELCTSLSERDEPVVLLIYGDHLPGLTIPGGELSDGTLYDSEYLLWSNYDAFTSQDGGDCTTYQITSHVLGLLGLNDDLIDRFHKTYSSRPDYLASLEALQYDLLYGDEYALSASGEFSVPGISDMRFGLRDIVIDSAALTDNTLIVSGSGFTPFSEIVIDGRRYNTVFISEERLIAENVLIDGSSLVAVAQVTEGGLEFTHTEAIGIVYAENIRP